MIRQVDVDRPFALPENPHAIPATEALCKLHVLAENGLSTSEAGKRHAAFGANTVAARPTAGWLRLLLHQFMSPVVYLLGAAVVLAFWFEEREEGVAIIAVLAVNAAIGFLTELKAARSIEALRALGTRTARLRRDGCVRVVLAEELVPGDIVLLDAGDAISADVRLVEASRLAADESTLTGESLPVEKSTHPVEPGARLAERTSMLFKGTAVTRGSGVGVVTATGLATELGRVSQLVIEADAGSSPLERKLARLSAQLVGLTLILAVAIAVAGLAKGQDVLLIIEAAIALAVAAVPEGLPIVATLALARGMWRMARQNALIEHLSAVETLGATTVILTDKTGTLTENRMTVRRLDTPSGEIRLDGALETQRLSQRAGGRHFALLLKIAALCNDADLDRAEDTGTGDPMEIALLRACLQAGMNRADLLRQNPLRRKQAFDPATKMMATIHANEAGVLVAVKGAPEAVVACASRLVDEEEDIALDGKMRQQWLAHAENLARQGLRVIACAMKTEAEATDGTPFDALTLIGLIGLADPARADVPEAIGNCRRAGIRVVMVTGDHAVTARSIGRAIGLDVAAQAVVEGERIEQVLATGQPPLRDIGVFARVSPAEKLALVRAYQDAGEIVAMTGDGVNDAPALQQADIGVAMGLRGTDVAREAAAMILLDDAFSTIVKAIREGRIIFGNIRRFVAYLLSCNLSELMVVGLAVASSLPLPLLPLQILYLNLVTDVFPAFALALGEGEEAILERPPRDPKEPILGRNQWFVIVAHGIILSAATFAALATAIWLDYDSRATVTVTFLTLAFAQLWHVFNMRAARANLFVNEVTRNGWLWAALALCALLLAVPPYLPPVAHLLHLAPLTLGMWGVVLACSLSPLVVTQTAAAFIRLMRAKGR